MTRGRTLERLCGRHFGVLRHLSARGEKSLRDGRALVLYISISARELFRTLIYVERFAIRLRRIRGSFEALLRRCSSRCVVVGFV